MRLRFAAVGEAVKVSREAATARAAGWRRSELWWEGLQSRAKSRQMSGDLDAAARCWMLAHGLALLFLARDDPRFACGLANAAAAAEHRGRLRLAEGRRQRAQALWRSVPAWIEKIRPAPRARSSLFHLRLAKRHAETWRENLRVELRSQVEGAEASLAAGLLEPPGERCRWERERPPHFDDTRRLLSACYLMAYVAPDARRTGAAGAPSAGDRPARSGSSARPPPRPGRT